MVGGRRRRNSDPRAKSERPPSEEKSHVSRLTMALVPARVASRLTHREK